MNNSWYSLNISITWVVLAAFIGLIASMLLYSKKNVPWNKNVNILLGFLRFTAISLLVILLFDPLLELSLNKTEKPILAVAIDDSESILLRTDSIELASFRNRLNTSLEGLNYDVHTYFLSENKDFEGYQATQSDLNSLIKKVKNIHEYDNLGGLLLISDGIHNIGASPQYTNFTFPIYTIGMGDTIPPKDLSISKVQNNRVAFQGNQFPIIVEITQNGFEGQKTAVTITKNGKEVASKIITLQQGLTSVDFILDADDTGLNRYKVIAAGLEGESSLDNNKQNIFIDIIESKVKILLIAEAPHPDIAAIRKTLASSKNYDVELYINGLTANPSREDYNVIIYHNTNSKKHKYTSKGKWIIPGPKNPSNRISNELNFLNIIVKNKNDDKVRPALNEDFALFDIKSEPNKALDYPTIDVPFGDYRTSGQTNILLYQKVGSVITDKPLMLFFDDGTEKIALTMNSGIWKWKLQEAGAFENSEFFNEIVLKTIQYVGLNEDKKRFIAEPRMKTFNANETVLIDTEVYNQIFERAYNEVIDITISDENGKSRSQQITNAPNNNTIRIGGLEEGIYTFQASVNISGVEKFLEKGQFLIKENKLEGILLTANHGLLRSISKNSGGKSWHMTELDEAVNFIENQKFKGIIKTEKTFSPLISTLWYIFLIMLLLTSEWVIRKYSGSV